MKKKLLCLLFISLFSICLLFTGCKLLKKKQNEKPKQEPTQEQTTTESFMVVVDSIEINENVCQILVHKETKIMYLMEFDGDLFVMIDVDGKPLLYEGEL